VISDLINFIIFNICIVEKMVISNFMSVRQSVSYMKFVEYLKLQEIDVCFV